MFKIKSVLFIAVSILGTLVHADDINTVVSATQAESFCSSKVKCKGHLSSVSSVTSDSVVCLDGTAIFIETSQKEIIHNGQKMDISAIQSCDSE